MLTYTELLFILIINFLIIIIIVVFLIRFVVNKFKESTADTHDRLSELEDKYNKLDVQFSRISTLHVSHQKNDSLAKDLEKVKLVVQGIDKKTEKIYKRTEKIFNKK